MFYDILGVTFLGEVLVEAPQLRAKAVSVCVCPVKSCILGGVFGPVPCPL